MVTLMRTSEEEAREVGRFIAVQLRQHARDPAMIEVWLPKGGISMIATPGGPFADATADQAMFKAIYDGLDGSDIQVKEDTRDINSASYAHDIAEALIEKIRTYERSRSIDGKDTYVRERH
jgi:uncharacterized protein (UPF0261 family)